MSNPFTPNAQPTIQLRLVQAAIALADVILAWNFDSSRGWRSAADAARVEWILEQRVDDMCWRDVYQELARFVNVKYVPQLICDKAQHLANCDRFIDSLRGGTYLPVYVVERQKRQNDLVAMMGVAMRLRDDVMETVESLDSYPYGVNLIEESLKRDVQQFDDAIKNDLNGGSGLLMEEDRKMLAKALLVGMSCDGAGGVVAEIVRDLAGRDDGKRKKKC